MGFLSVGKDADSGPVVAVLLVGEDLTVVLMGLCYW